MVPLDDDMTFWVATVGLGDDVSGCPVELLNSESDCYFMDDDVVVTEMFPVVSTKNDTMPTSLPTMSEVFSSAVLAGGRC